MILGAVNGIVNGAELELLGLGIGVMVLSAVVNLFVSSWLLKVARETDSARSRPRGTTCALTSGAPPVWPWGS